MKIFKRKKEYNAMDFGDIASKIIGIATRVGIETIIIAFTEVFFAIVKCIFRF